MLLAQLLLVFEGITVDFPRVFHEFYFGTNFLQGFPVFKMISTSRNSKAGLMRLRPR